MSQIQSVVNSLLARAAKTDPVMLSILQEILDELDRIGLEVFPPPDVGGKITPITKPAPSDVVSFTYRLTTENVILEWIAPSTDFLYYELRKGNNWDTASRLLVTANNQVILDPLPVGTHRYLLRSLVAGIYSSGITSVDVIIPSLGPVAITTQVIDQSILFNWTIPITTFSIDKYNIKRNGVFFSTSRSNFHVITENEGGKYTYGITPVDIAGNLGPETTVTVELAPPKDFVLYSTQTSDFSGTRNNAKVQGLRLLVPVDNAATYQAHFTTRSWASPQAQVTAGYARWLTHTPVTAYYEQVFDFGVVLSNVIVTLSWQYEIVEGAFTIGSDAKVSNDNISYGTSFVTPTFFVTSGRYIKVRMNFTGGNDKALMWFYNFKISVSVKLETDSGQATAYASDATGTVVNFAKLFYDINGITIAAMSTTTVIPIVDFVDIPNPTFFKVYIYDNTGTRITREFRWDARGVL